MSDVNGVLGAGFAGLPEKVKLEKAAHELEAVVLTQLLAAMRETVPKGGLFEESASQDLFQSMLDEELARSSAAKSPFGLADAVMKQLGAAFKTDEGDAEGTKRSASGAASTAAEAAKAGIVALDTFRRIG